MSDGKEGLVNKENVRNRERQTDRDIEKRFAEANRDAGKCNGFRDRARKEKRERCVMIKEGKPGISTMEAVGVYGRIIVGSSIGISGQHSYLKCKHYQRKEGRKEGTLSLLMNPLIQATFIKYFLQFSLYNV